jgi:biotin carboxyl carrier protein
MTQPALINGIERNLDGDAREIDLVELRPGVYSALSGGRSIEIFLEQTGDGVYRATIDGRVHQIELRDPRSYVAAGGAGGEDGPHTIKAQMPGKVVQILAAVGDEVEAEQGILVVEAMKMQNEILAPRAGRVVSINVAPGDSVETGRALAVLE